MHQINIILLILILIISGLTDLFYQKIYNVITFPAIILGPFINYYYEGWHGVICSLSGLCICFLIFFILYIWGGFGAGDVKLMMAVGSLIGSLHVLNIILYSAIFGAVIANIVILKKKKFLQTWIRVLRFFLFLIPNVKLKSEPLHPHNSEIIPFGCAISAGALIYLFFNY